MICNYILHCVSTFQSQIFFHHHIFGLLYPLPPLLPLPSGNHHTVVWVYEFFIVFLVCLLVAFSFITYMWVSSYDSWMFLSDLFHLAWHSQDPFMLSQMAVFHLFLCLSSIPFQGYPTFWRLWATLGKTVVLSHTLNIWWHVITKKPHNVLSEFTILCWVAFIAILCRRLDSPGYVPHLLYPIIYWRIPWLFSCLGHHE